MLIKQKRKVVIYSTPTCSVCKRTREYFSQKGIPFIEIDVSTDSKAAEEMFKKSGQIGVPVIFVGEVVQVGFNALKLDAALKR